MAQGVLRGSEVIPDGELSNAIKQFENLASAINLSKQELKEIGEQSQKTFSSLDLSKSSKDVDTFNKLLKDTTDAKEQLAKQNVESAEAEKILNDLKKRQLKLDEQELKLKKKEEQQKKKINNLTDEEIKEKIKLQEINKKRRKDIQAEVILEAKSIKSKADLRDRIKALNTVGADLDLGSDELAANIAEINRLTVQLSENGSEREKNIANIGNYKSATEGLTNSYDDQKKKLDVLEKSYKDIIATGGKWAGIVTSEGRAVRKELKKQKKSLEEVEEAAKDTGSGFSAIGTGLKAAGIGVIIALFSTLGDLFSTSREASLETGKNLAVLTESVKVFFNSLVNARDGIKGILTAVAQSIEGSFLSIQKIALDTQISIEGLFNTFSSRGNVINKLNADLKEITDRQKELSEENVTISDSYDKITKAFDNNVERTKDAIKGQQDYKDLQLNTTLEIEKQTRALAGLQERRQILQDISDDDTLGFLERAVAVEKAQKAAIEFARLDEKLARTKEALTIAEVKQELLVSGIRKKAFLDQITTGKQLNDLIKQRSVAIKLSDEAEAKFTEAFVERIDKQAEAEAFNRDQEEKNRKTARDGFEQTADIIEEFAEKRFAVNEAIINNDKKTAEERRKALEDNKVLTEQLSNEILTLTIEQGKKSIDIRKDLTDAEKEERKAKIDNLNVDKILNAESEKQIALLIESADLGEIETKRIKDSFKIKSEQNEALKQQEEDLKESDRTTLELKREIEAQSEALDQKGVESAEDRIKKIEKLEEDRFNLEKQNLRERIELLQSDSIARLELEKELNDLLLEEEKEKAEKLKEEDKKSVEERKKSISSLLDFSSELNKNISKNLLDQIKTESNDVKKQQDLLNARILAGNDEANESLLLLNKKQTELRAKEKQEIKRAQNFELILSGLKAYSANVSKGDGKGAVAKTLRDSAVVKQGLEKIATFYKGTELVSRALGTKDLNTTRDGHVVRVDGTERIINGADNSKLPSSVSNEMLVDAGVEKYGTKVGEVPEKYINKSIDKSNVSVKIDEKAIVKGVKEALKSFPKNDIDYNTLSKIISDSQESKNAKETLKRKVKGSFL